VRTGKGVTVLFFYSRHKHGNPATFEEPRVLQRE
jgi:hypothetical protein